jgi:hypothetical protein
MPIFLIFLIFLGCGGEFVSYTDEALSSYDNNIVYDFINESGNAVWHDDTKLIYINENSENAYVKKEDLALVLSPENKENSFIHGAYLIDFPVGDNLFLNLKANIEQDEYNLEPCYVRLYSLEDTNLIEIANLELSRDNPINSDEIDLSLFQATKSILILGVDMHAAYPNIRVNILEAKIITK